MTTVPLAQLVDLDRAQIWKVGAGDGNRSHADLLRQYDVFAAGPGEPGPYEPGRPYVFDGGEKRHIPQFYEEVQPGDVFIMRVGVSDVQGIGIVQDGQAEYDEAWGDVDGWNVSHIRRVKWISGPTDALGREGFGSQGSTLQRLWDPRVLARLAKIPVSEDVWAHPLRDRPGSGKPLTIEQLCDEMVEHGLDLEAAEELRGVLQRTRRLVRWYKESRLGPEASGMYISEHETLSYIAIPLLQAVGWTHQLLGIEWKGIDAVLFDELPRAEASVRAIVEAKSLGSSLRYATAQGQGYVSLKKLPNCRTVLATDGPRWMIHEKQHDGIWKLTAYLNLIKPVNGYPVLGNVLGAVEVLRLLQRG